MKDKSDFGQVNWSLHDDHAEDRKMHLDDVWKNIQHRETDNISIGQIPESEEQTANAWYDLFKALGTLECRLDPRLNHKNGEPYDPIDLAFRIVDTLKSIKEIRSKIADKFCFSEPAIRSF